MSAYGRKQTFVNVNIYMKRIYVSHGLIAGFLVHADGRIAIGATIPPQVLEWLDST